MVRGEGARTRSGVTTSRVQYRSKLSLISNFHWHLQLRCVASVIWPSYLILRNVESSRNGQQAGQDAHHCDSTHI